MAADRIAQEWLARILVAFLVLALPGAAILARMLTDRHAIEVVAMMPEAGGWLPGHLTATVGEPLSLRLISDDVVHGFAIGQDERPAVEVKPGRVTELTLTFDRAGRYTFYCTRWCGPGHWRMRGTIEVAGPGRPLTSAPPALYMTLGIDLDAQRPAGVLLARKPSAAAGEVLGAIIPAEYGARDYVRGHSPLAVWQDLRRDQRTAPLGDVDLWDMVAWIWRRTTTPEALQTGRRLYAENCAACHGVVGKGDGVMAASLRDLAAPLDGAPDSGVGHRITTPANFTATELLGASPALLHGKILRGGMGTGMPYWGPIFTDAQLWALVDYLWQFQFHYERSNTQ